MIIKDIKNITIAKYMEYVAEMKRYPWGTGEIQGVSFVTEAKEGDSTETLPCQLPPKDMNPRSLTLPSTIEKDPNDYDQCAPNSHQEDEELSSVEDVDELLNTEIEYMEYEEEIKRHPWRYAQSYTRSLGSTTLGRKKDPNDYDICAPNSHHEDEEISSEEDVDEWLNVKIVIDMLEGPNETMLLGKPFLATIHAQIDVFRREISLGI
nr:hypothetical protein [Tanacetum cinerariifolium]